jgi:hypothetical protein
MKPKKESRSAASAEANATIGLDENDSRQATPAQSRRRNGAAARIGRRVVITTMPIPARLMSDSMVAGFTSEFRCAR